MTGDFGGGGADLAFLVVDVGKETEDTVDDGMPADDDEGEGGGVVDIRVHPGGEGDGSLDAGEESPEAAVARKVEEGGDAGALRARGGGKVGVPSSAQTREREFGGVEKGGGALGDGMGGGAGETVAVADACDAGEEAAGTSGAGRRCRRGGERR